MLDVFMYNGPGNNTLHPTLAVMHNRLGNNISVMLDIVMCNGLGNSTLNITFVFVYVTVSSMTHLVLAIL